MNALASGTEGSADEVAGELMKETDFVMPMKQVGLLTRTVLEAVHALYGPRRVVVVAPRREVALLRALSAHWDVDPLELICEEDFFSPTIRLSELLGEYEDSRSGEQREPGWWLQQLIKLGAAFQVPGISPVYICWDADLVPVRPWRLCGRGEGGEARFFIAILQAAPRSAFNRAEYAACMRALCGFEPRHPIGGGTFVSHHMCFHTAVVGELLQHMQRHTGSSLPWPLLIMSFSRRFCRFSEYMTYATYAITRQESLNAQFSTGGNVTIPAFEYHHLGQFGSGGVRFRQADEAVCELRDRCGISAGGIPFIKVREYAQKRWPGAGYVQLDRVYGLSGEELLLPPATGPFTHEGADGTERPSLGPALGSSESSGRWSVTSSDDTTTSEDTAAAELSSFTGDES